MIGYPLYIFDLDGTLADATHRIHHIRGDGRRDWRAFFAACKDDTPNVPVVTTMNRLLMQADVWIWSGRSDEVRDDTIEWLAYHTLLDGSTIEDVLTMRREGDYTDDATLKEAWLKNMNASDRARLVAVFDDRHRVVEMWRRNGVPCFQVAPGRF